MQKKILTRAEFEALRIGAAEKMAADTGLINAARDLKVAAGHKYYYVHQTNWMGEPCLQLPQDMFAFQEVLFKSRPDYIVECGVAWGGTLLYFASLLKLLGGKKVIGIDVFIPEDLRERLTGPQNPLASMIELINASSVEESTAEKVRKIVGSDSTVLVVLDSDHTHEHVLRELKLYAPLVKKGQYLICGDTIIEYQPPADERPRPWGKGNNPATALREYMKANDGFEIDRELENKLLMSNMPGGYLRRVR